MLVLKTMAKISELTSGQGNVDVEGVLSELGDTRTFNKFGKELSVANGILKDDSGSIKLSLWNEDVTKFKNGDNIKITNGYVNEFQGEKQLTSGKFGTIALADGSSSSDQENAPAEEESTETSEETPSEPAEAVEAPSDFSGEPKEEVF